MRFNICYKTGCITFLIFCIVVSSQNLLFADQSPIFPIPREMEISGKQFELNEHVVILVPENASDHDLSLARFLVRELTDRYGIALQTTSTAKLPTQKSFILMGSVNNPLVQEYCQKKKLPISAKQPGPEGYLLNVSEKTVLVAGSDDQGAFYGLQSLRQLIEKDKIAGVKVRDWPRTQFRGIRLYIPGRENIPFFKRFLKDFMALYKFNKVVLEVNACMRFDSHPELNAGWIEFANSMHYARRSRPAGPHNQYQDSAHHDAGDGGVLEKAEVKDLVNFATDHYIEVIPEIPTLTHSYYLLSRHRELAEIQSAEWPDTYCPSNPKSYELLFDVLDEYIEVIRPKMIHIGKDEWRMEVNVCSNCTGKDYTELFVSDINKIYQYISGKNINVGMWGDHLLESVREKGFRDRKTSTGYEYQIPGSITPEQVTHEIPKDILLFNWFWGDENNDLALETFGFKQVYGNFRPNISSWEKRSQWKSVLGGAPSSWAATTEFNFGKDLLYDFLGCANLLWSEEYLDHQSLAKTVRQLLPEIRGYLSGRKYPSEDNNAIASINLSRYFNTSHNRDFAGVKLAGLKSGEVGDKKFILADPKSAQDNSAIVIGSGSSQTSNLDQRVDRIEINDDASSLIFLHACARDAGNHKAYRRIYDFESTADLLGWYEVTYEDGYTITIPIQYGVNILDMNINKRDKDEWAEGKTGAPQNVYCYLGEPVECAQTGNDSKMFFSYEWKNPRLGKIIKHITLKGTDSFRNPYDKEIPENAIILLAISYTEKRPVPDVNIK